MDPGLQNLNCYGKHMPDIVALLVLTAKVYDVPALFGLCLSIWLSGGFYVCSFQSLLRSEA